MKNVPPDRTEGYKDNFMKKVLIFLGLSLVALVAIVVLVRIQFKLVQGKQKPVETVYNVGTIKLKKELIKETLSVQSIIQGNPQVKVYPNTTGLLINNTVKEGDYVYKDQVISYIDRAIVGSDYQPAPVKAPISGMVIKLYYQDKGANISMQQPLAEIANVGSVKAVVNLGESDLLKVKNGLPATVSSVYSRDVVINSTVNSVTPFVDSDTFSGSAMVLIDNSKGLFKIGMTVNIDIQIGSRTGYFVPESTVLTSRDKTFIFLNDNNKAKEFPVQTGYIKNGFVELIADLKENAEIITDGNFKLSDGARINVVN
jgi:multidrug efflux pump subunit AcrA (membrane-fusion protein)